jgi:suppressor of fused
VIRRAEPDGPPPRGTLAIDDHVDRADGGPEFDRRHPRPTNRFAGPGPVEAVTIHRIADPPHWHLVTYGLTELDAKESSDPEISGWGFELTLRVADDASPGASGDAIAPNGAAANGEAPGPDPPLWAVDVLASLAAYVRSSGHPFAAGHNLDLRGPIKTDSSSEITAALVVEDPVLASMAGPYGRVQFLQVVGITADELELCRSWSTEGVVDLLSRDDPLLVTRLDRPAVTHDVRFAAEIVERSSREGSSLHELRVASLKLRRRPGRTTVQMGSGAARALGPALRRELVGDGAAFSVLGDDAELRFAVAENASWWWTDAGLELLLPLDVVERVAALFDGRTGARRVGGWPRLAFRVVK